MRKTGSFPRPTRRALRGSGMDSADRRQPARSSDRLRRLPTCISHTDEPHPLSMTRKKSGVHEAFFFSFAFDVASTMGRVCGGARSSACSFAISEGPVRSYLTSRAFYPTLPTSARLVSLVPCRLKSIKSWFESWLLPPPHPCASVLLAYPSFLSRLSGSAWGHAADLAPSSIGLHAAICLAFAVFLFCGSKRVCRYNYLCHEIYSLVYAMRHFPPLKLGYVTSGFLFIISPVV